MGDRAASGLHRGVSWCDCWLTQSHNKNTHPTIRLRPPSPHTLRESHVKCEYSRILSKTFQGLILTASSMTAFSAIKAAEMSPKTCLCARNARVAFFLRHRNITYDSYPTSREVVLSHLTHTNRHTQRWLRQQHGWRGLETTTTHTHTHTQTLYLFTGTDKLKTHTHTQGHARISSSENTAVNQTEATQVTRVHICNTHNM